MFSGELFTSCLESIIRNYENFSHLDFMLFVERPDIRDSLNKIFQQNTIMKDFRNF